MLYEYVIRKKYNGDILFKVIKIIDDTAILKGVYIRLYATAKLDDLIKISNYELRFYEQKIDRIENTIFSDYKSNVNHLTGKILHIDSDIFYLKKCNKVYEKLGLFAICVKLEPRQIKDYVLELVKAYNIDIVVLTGHDSFNGKAKENINNYQNSKYFKEGILILRKYYNIDSLFIFAGACQSHYEELIASGANMASSKKRVNIDAYDPLICAVKAATTPFNKIISFDSIWKHSYSKGDGISGVESYGKMRILR